MASHRKIFQQVLQATGTDSILAPLFGEARTRTWVPSDGDELCSSVKELAGTCQYSYRNFLGNATRSVNTALFVTKSGYVGKAPTVIASGDVVCVLQGLSVPVVLRRVGESHKLIGSCFVLDLMDGLAWNGLRRAWQLLTRFLFPREFWGWKR